MDYPYQKTVVASVHPLSATVLGAVYPLPYCGAV